MDDYDLTIIGGGPAGATLARLLADKYRILLIDKARPKCCGGLLAPDAQKMIARLGLVLPDSVLNGPQLFSVLVHDFDAKSGSEHHTDFFSSPQYQRHYINMSREKFDQWLVSLIPSNVDVLTPARYLGCEPNGPNGKLTLRYQRNDTQNGGSGNDDDNDNSNDAITTATTRVLIGADGAFSNVRRQFVPPHRDRELYVAVQHWFEPGLHSSCYGAIFDREITDYYGWTIPKGDQLIVGAAMPAHCKVRERFACLVEKLRKIGLPLEKETFRESAQIVRPRSWRAVCPLVQNQPIALLGEAAGWVSPSSAEGISYAMRSAVALADALLWGIDDFQKRYMRNLLPLYLNLGFKHVKRPAMYWPLLRNVIIKSGLKTLDVRK